MLGVQTWVCPLGLTAQSLLPPPVYTHTHTHTHTHMAHTHGTHSQLQQDVSLSMLWLPYMVIHVLGWPGMSQRSMCVCACVIHTHTHTHNQQTKAPLYASTLRVGMPSLCARARVCLPPHAKSSTTHPCRQIFCRWVQDVCASVYVRVCCTYIHTHTHARVRAHIHTQETTHLCREVLSRRVKALCVSG